jgi:ribosomal protein S18 acetylase RimI-like enzyme
MSGSSIRIKELGKKDREAAVRFVRKMMRWTMRKYAEGNRSEEALDHHVSTAVQTLDLAIKDPNHYCMIAVRNGTIIGIALGKVLGGVGSIDWMAVTPEYHRRGVGKKMMAAVEELMHSRGCHKMTLFAFDSYVPALGLYLKWGMVPEATLKEHMFGDDYLVMSKWLERRKRRLK